MKIKNSSLAIALSILSALLIIMFTLIFIFKTSDTNAGSSGTESWVQYGDIIGGVVGTLVAFVGVLLLFETLKEQRIVFTKQQIETRFFELVKLHKENVNEMKLKGKTGRAVFVSFRDDMNILMREIEARYDQQPREDRELEWTKSVATWRKEIAQISYLILFFGVNNSSDEESKRTIKVISSPRGNSDTLIAYFEQLVQSHEAAKANNRKAKHDPTLNKQPLPFDGQQVRLAHYFRHLYQTIKYINNQPTDLLPFKEKEQYVKLLRAQLSTHEQALIFYTSLFEVGKSWELDRKKIDDQLLTKYDLIRNMPKGFTGQLDPKNYYPNLYFEYDSSVTSEKKEMIKRYQ